MGICICAELVKSYAGFSRTHRRGMHVILRVEVLLFVVCM